MSTSLRSIGARMDPVASRISLQGQFRQHGWPGVRRGELPAGRLPLSRLARRHAQSLQLRFLSYNTFLLPGVTIPIGRYVNDQIGFAGLEALGLRVTPGVFAQLGVVDRLCDLLPFPADAACKALGDPVDFVLETLGLTPAGVLEKLGISPVDVLKKVFGLSLDVIHLGGKPELAERSSSLGAACAGYDVLSLCEVWEGRERDGLLRALQDAGGALSVATGSAADASTVLGSGLCTIVRHPQLRLTGAQQMIYTNRGDRRKDSDAWANKGVLRTEVDLGFGRLEIYSTHLYNGNDLPVVPPVVVKPTAGEMAANQVKQLDELVDFYRSTHRAENVALVTGDFNVDATKRLDVDDRMAAIGMQNAWTLCTTGNASLGLTNRNADDAAHPPLERTFDQICRRSTRAGFPRPDGAAHEDYYCDDSQADALPNAATDGRVDYIFIENPAADHRFTLDVSRVLRRAFQRPPSAGSEGFLSDHVGLDVLLVASPREASRPLKNAV